MSLFSRLLGKPPQPAPAAAPVAQAPAAKPDKPDGAERARAAAAEDAALRAAIAAGDTTVVGRLVLEGSSTKVRQAAAQAIEDAEQLRQLLRELKGGKDQTVYKILASKRDAQSAEARQRAQRMQEIEEAAAAIERHSQRPYDSSYSPLLMQYETRWEAVAPQAEAATITRVQQALDRARATIAEHARQIAAEAAQAEAAALAAAEAQRAREQQALAAAEVAAEQARTRAEQAQAQAAQQAAAAQALREISEWIRKARAALREGGTARAAEMRAVIESQLAEAPPLPAGVASQLQQLDAQLQQLKDWKQFSVTPKRAELIEEMRLLVEASLEPLALAERIRSLQAEWRGLSKGAGEDFAAEDQQFREATQRAYQPCQVYFAAQAVVRKENYQLREALLARLKAFEAETNWEQADWAGVVKLLRETKQAWRGHVPVERQPGKQQDEAFAAITASLQGRVEAEHARNVQQKEALITRAQQALASEDARQATDEIKRLQQAWKSVGPVPQGLDQRLWQDFRRHCDAVFQKREQATVAHAAGIEHNKAQALAFCEQVEHIATLEGADLLAGLATLGERRAAFEALGELPRADALSLRKRFDQGLARCKVAQARHQARDAEQSWADLFTAADHVRAYRFAAAQGVDAEALAALKATAEAFMTAVPRWPKGGRDELQRALAAEPAADFAAHERALRLLCIRAEILTDQPTPAEDQALRREHQLQRLVQGMGQRTKNDEAPLDALALDWIAAEPVEATVYAPLLQRFQRCRTQGSTTRG